jgi:cytochrome c554/c'-like protein
MKSLGAILLGLGLLIFTTGTAPGQTQRTSGLSSAEREFLDRHWRRPILPQGEVPEGFTPLEGSLAPADCGGCHPVQFADWQSSIHSKSMGPGIGGQLVGMIRSDPAGARSCPACHAPLAEQSPELLGPDGVAPNPAFDDSLRRQGVVCAACHVRGHRRFGPPPRVGTVAAVPSGGRPPHAGATYTTAYLRSEFCSSCHQFGPNGLSLNGKSLENTYEEWRRSPAARQGLQCQDCHMPDRRHRWRGIHDPDMVKSGIRIRLATNKPRYRPGERLRATLTIASVKVGHYFPTYVTPRVVVRAELLDATGAVIPDSVEERAIGRQVPLDLSREIADTRIPPGGRFTLRYARRLEQRGSRLRVTVTVFPDHFYTGFFEALLAAVTDEGEAALREALEDTRRSAFPVFSREVPLT